MIITCPECETKYRYDERRFDGETLKQVKCTSCGFSFEVVNPALEAAESGTTDDAGAGEKFKLADYSGASWNPAGSLSVGLKAELRLASPPSRKASPAWWGSSFFSVGAEVSIWT